MSMRSERMSVDGQWTDPNPHSHRPRGNVEQADNIVFRRPGTAELRPGFMELDSARAEWAGFTAPDGAFAFDGDLMVQQNGGSLAQYIASVAFEDEFGDPVSCPPNAVRGVDAGETFYFCGSDGVRKLYEGVNRTVQVGVPTPHLRVLGAAASGSSGAVAPLSYVAYRGVLQVVYEDERTVTSGFSARVVLYNADAADRMAPDVRMFLPHGLDVVAPTAKIYASVYRTKNASAYPGDELFLAYSRKQVTAAHVVFGSVSFASSDVLDDDQLGEALYTNPSRETFVRNNARAPRAEDLQVYAGSLFAARLTYPWRKQVRYRAIGTGDRSGNATGVGVRAATCDVTDESADLTNVSVVTGLQVGMMVAVNLAQVANPGTPLLIAGISGSTVTLDRPITNGSAVGRDVKFYDAVHISIDSETEVFPLVTHRGPQGLLEAMLIGESSATMDDEEPYCTPSDRLRGVVIGDIARYEEATLDGGHMVNAYLTRFDASGAQFHVAATHGDEFNPPLALPTDAEADWTEAERTPSEDALTWSKNEEPEHFFEGITRKIGVPGIPILRIFATVDGLWILKARGDGIYRLTGFGERTGWRVDQVSKTCALLHPNLACSDGRSVYAWTNEGAVRVDAGGLVKLSAGLIGTRWKQTERALVFDSENTGCFAVANRKDNEILFGMPEYAGPNGHCKEIVCFNTVTKAWSTWFPGSDTWAAAVYADCLMDQPGPALYGLIHLLPGAQGYARQEREVSSFVDMDWIERADLHHSVQVATADGAEITITAGSDWTPVVGDVVVDNPEERYIVIAVEDATTFTVDRSGLSTGGATAYEAFTATLRWAADFGGGPSLHKVFERVVLHCDSTVVTRDLSIGMQVPPGAQVDQARSLSTYISRLFVEGSKHEWPEDIRADVPVNAANGTRLLVSTTLRQADSRIRIAGLTVQYRDAAPVGSGQR